MSELVDAVVIGGTMRGLVAAHVLAHLGFRVVLVERSPRMGGADASFRTASGATFDHGLHVLDADRSALATRLFTHVVGGAVNRVTLRRGIVLRGHVVPYAPRPDQLPPALRELLPDGDLVDDIGDDLPTRQRLASCYGQPFTDLILDEVLPSFPSEHRHLSFGVDEALLLTNIYPWFFPAAKRRGSADESRAFHDRLRDGIPQDVLTPREGGFGGFAEGFLKGLRAVDHVEILTGADDLDVEVIPGTHRVASVRAGGRRFEARHYFWGAGWAPFCALLDLPCQDAATDQVVIGSFVLDRPASTEFHELLVGDPGRWINRVHFPSMFRGTDDPLVQVEFAHPVHADGWDFEGPEWLDRWLDDLRVLGVIGDHRVVDRDFRAFTMHFNGFGAEGVARRDADETMLLSDRNFHPIVPSMANLNLNRYVARTVEQVTRVLAGGDDGASRIR